MARSFESSLAEDGQRANNRTGRRERGPQADSGLSEWRVPPHSLEAEQSVLGGLLLDNHAFDKIDDLIAEGDLYREEHSRIYHQSRNMREHGDRGPGLSG